MLAHPGLACSPRSPGATAKAARSAGNFCPLGRGIRPAFTLAG
jgi:hypothetical protein